MANNSIDQLIINSPYEEPTLYWSYERLTRTFSKKDGRRPAGYVIASESSKSFDDPGIFVEIPLVNAIRPRVKAWREAGYPGVTGITKRLLEHWKNLEERDCGSVRSPWMCLTKMRFACMSASAIKLPGRRTYTACISTAW